ncbi:MAG TPA: hypothetical protein VIG04_07485 [Gemmatimonadales bacterium]|jgi:hypothetical protein
MTTSPSLTEFTTTVREAFRYLGPAFGFREVPPPAPRLAVNPFMIWFQNPTTLVQVQGINWGFAAQVLLGPADGDDVSAAVPLWAIIQHRRPDLSREPQGQLGDVRAYAEALREVAGDVLQGEFEVFGSARRILDAQMTRHTNERREQARAAAVAGAAEAFRAGNFGRVIELLGPHVELLSPAERARLDYAHARVR